MKRTLRLHRETLTDLSAADLVAVAGGAADYSRVGFTCPQLDCLERFTIGCDGFSVNAC